MSMATVSMEENISTIVADTITELFDMLGKGEAGSQNEIICQLMSRESSILSPFQIKKSI